MKEKIALFFVEIGKRWGQRSPKFMRILVVINGAIGFIGGIGYTLAQLQVVFPNSVTAKVVFAIIGFCGSYAAANNNLVTSKTNDLPLTEKMKQEEAAKTILYPSLEQFPVHGFDGFIYHSAATDKKYKWNGTSYQERK